MIPRIAIIDKNTLEAMGLMSIISDIIPRADISVFTSVQELKQEVVDEEQEIGVAAHECVGCGLH